MLSVRADINECNNVTCSDENSNCVNSIGSFTCQCNRGFAGDGYKCSGTFNGIE